LNKLAILLTLLPALHAQSALTVLTGKTPLLDAHNCYPYDGRWTDRRDRALSAGFPVAIEQDLAWYTDPATGASRSIVTHGKPFTGQEPDLRSYFFEPVRPLIERALAENDRARWPLIVLHFDFKDNTPAHIRAIWKLLGVYEAWLTTAVKTADPATLSPMDVKPLLVLTEDSDAQEEIFFRDPPVGSRLRIFGSAKADDSYLQGLSREQRRAAAAKIAPERLVDTPPTNYRRWWNNSWALVEEGHAGDWTPAKQRRLESLVNHAHHLGYAIRFYTLDGFAPADDQGWGNDYNFGSLEAVRKRWRATLEAGVDLIATDQYEALAAFMKAGTLRPAPP
jgi:hypothetical protein